MKKHIRVGYVNAYNVARGFAALNIQRSGSRARNGRAIIAMVIKNSALSSTIAAKKEYFLADGIMTARAPAKPASRYGYHRTAHSLSRVDPV